MKSFIVLLNEIENRIDPLYYSQDVFQLIKKSSHKVMTISEVARYLKSGFPAGGKLQSDEGIIQIRPTNINSDNLLIFEKNIYIKNNYADKKKHEMLKKGEVLFNNTNSQELVGKTAYFNADGEFFCSNHITRIGVNKEIIHPKYLWMYTV